MKLATALFSGGIAALIAASSIGTASAQEVTTTSTTKEAEVTTTSSGPNVPVITTGAVLFGGTYLASVIVAAASPHPGDEKLYIPVVGPWLDLADRPACGDNDPSCGNEGLNKALLITDGIVQGVGVITMVAGFFIPEKKVTSGATTVGTIKVTPMSVGRHGYGLGALGTF